MIRVLIAEDQALLRQALADILARYEDLNVVSQVGNGDEIVAAALHTRPDVALLDIEMPGRDGLTAAGRRHHRPPNCPAFCLSGFCRPRVPSPPLVHRPVGFRLHGWSAS